MPNIKSQKKRVATNEKARLRNKANKTRYKNAIKKVLAAMNEKKAREEVLTLLSGAFKMLDKAASNGAIHANQASRRKSRLHHKVKVYLGEVAPKAE